MVQAVELPVAAGATTMADNEARGSPRPTEERKIFRKCLAAEAPGGGGRGGGGRGGGEAWAGGVARAAKIAGAGAEVDRGEEAMAGEGTFASK